MEERQIRTGIDKFLDLVNAGKELKLSEASKKLGVPEPTLEIWADILLKEGLVEIGYDGFGKMAVRRVQEIRQEPETPIREIAKTSPLEKEHKMSLRERLSGMKHKNGHALLKKYSKIRKSDATAPHKDSVFSRFLRIFGHSKKSEPIAAAPITHSFGPVEKGRLGGETGRVADLRKQTARRKRKGKF